jgi:hypothetical protein
MEARMRIIIAALAVAASPSLAIAQSLPATGGAMQPTVTPPASNRARIEEPKKIEDPKSKIPPAANTTTRGLHVGQDALDAGPIEIQRNK